MKAGLCLVEVESPTRDRGSNREISANLRENLRGRKVREPDLIQLLFVEKEPIVQNKELVVPRPVEVIQRLREPREVLPMPGVGSKRDAESGTVEKYVKRFTRKILSESRTCKSPYRHRA